MKKNIFWLVSAIFLVAGCAPYKFHHGQPPLDKGYVAARDGKDIPEYTIGKDNTTPGIKLAKERFNRRKDIVEDYYKKMNIIRNRFRENVPDRVGFMLKLMGSAFTMPGRIISALRYEHDPKYRDRVDKMDEEKEAKEAARVNKLKKELDSYIQQDLAKEPPQEQPKEQPKKEPKEEPQNIGSANSI